MIADVLTSDRIAAHLRTQRYGRSLDVRASTASTNDDARAAADAGAPDGHVVVADAQTAGRGRHGHAWDSPPGRNLYFSVVARTSLPLRDLPPLTLAVGLAVAEVAEHHTGTPVHVKWPNDVWIGERKVAGILVETTTSNDPPVPVIGVGLNVNRCDFGELSEIATSLARHAGKTLDRALVLADCLFAIEHTLDGFLAEGPASIVSALNARLALRGEPVRLDDLEGTLVGVAPSGAVRLHTPEGVVERTAGQLTRRPPNRVDRAPPGLSSHDQLAVQGLLDPRDDRHPTQVARPDEPPRDVIDAVRAALADEARVVVAYVFGSQVRRPRPDSDIDIAVLLDPPPGPNEKAGLVRKLAGTLGRELRADRLDLVFLDDAPPALAFQVVKHGRVALCSDPSALHRFKVATYRRHADREPTERLFREVTRRRARREAWGG